MNRSVAWGFTLAQVIYKKEYKECSKAQTTISGFFVLNLFSGGHEIGRDRNSRKAWPDHQWCNRVESRSSFLTAIFRRGLTCRERCSNQRGRKLFDTRIWWIGQERIHPRRESRLEHVNEEWSSTQMCETVPSRHSTTTARKHWGRNKTHWSSSQIDARSTEV